VAAASPAIVLAAKAGTTAALRLRAANAARIRFFIGSLHLGSGGMSGFDGPIHGPMQPR
jgi:hypothetical protein